MRNLATIQTIAAIEPIQNADAIEKVTILGWHCVAKKGEFKVGDKCVYFEIDSLLPKLPQFEFLANKGIKKTLVDGKELEGYVFRSVKEMRDEDLGRLSFKVINPEYLLSGGE